MPDSPYTRAKERYRNYRNETRALLEEETLAQFRSMRVDVVGIDDDVHRKVEKQWYDHANRRVDWDWERDICEPLLSFGPRVFHAAFLVRGQLCGLVAARLSPAKQWLSLTYLEGSPVPGHPLKGLVLPLAVRSLYVFRGVISQRDGELAPKMPGLRVLRPLPDALDCYRARGYTREILAKKDSVIVIEPPK